MTVTPDPYGRVEVLIPATPPVAALKTAAWAEGIATRGRDIDLVRLCGYGCRRAKGRPMFPTDRKAKA